MTTTDVLLLCGMAFTAGLVDSIVGGGGLIQVPALFILLPHMPVATLLGTNKFSSVAGTAAAAGQYVRRVSLDWRAILPAIVPAVLFSLLGAQTVSSMNAETLRPIVPVLLIAVAVYTFVKKELGTSHRPWLSRKAQLWVSLVVGAALGFYDGFFGPGQGSFLVFAYVGFFGFSFVVASASAKVINTATNLAAMLFFAATGHIYYAAAIPMSLCNILGSVVGARLAIARGSRFVRTLFLGVVLAVIARSVF
ncbi:MAG: uncharacterized protein QOH93_300 [Chloroflexia bacterium]|jgi:uncharacterized membrane protein YfcA|nr:uncharacterized protein [Chloroflexia bacterium]